MSLNDAIKLIEERKKKWERYHDEIYEHLYNGGKHPLALLKELMGDDYECEYLLSDEFLDNECASIVIWELERVIELLKKLEANGGGSND